MTVATTTITAGPFTGNGIATAFPFLFRIDAASQLVVYETDLAGAVTELDLGVDYTVAGVGNDAGGTVTRVAGALPTGFKWYMRRRTAVTQETSFSSQGGFFPDIHEGAIDKLTFLIQELRDQTSRTLRFPDSYSGGADAELPDALPLYYLRWNADGTAIELAPGVNVNPFNQSLNTISDVEFNSLTLDDWLLAEGPVHFKQTLQVDGIITCIAHMQATGFHAASTQPVFSAGESDTDTFARLMISGGATYLEAGSVGGGQSGSGTVRVSGWGGSNVAEFTVRSGGAWQTIWHSGNDGVGSGLDADLLDGQQATAFGRYATAGTWTATQTISCTGVFNDVTALRADLDVQSPSGSPSFMQFHRVGEFGAYFGVDIDNRLKWGGWSLGANAYDVWNAHVAPIGTSSEIQAAAVTTPRMWAPNVLSAAIQAVGGTATSGSNANGTWIRLPSVNMQICFHRLFVNSAATWTFPAAFSSAARVVSAPIHDGNTLHPAVTTAPSSTSVGISARNWSTDAVAIGTFDLIAIGPYTP